MFSLYGAMLRPNLPADLAVAAKGDDEPVMVMFLVLHST